MTFDDIPWQMMIFGDVSWQNMSSIIMTWLHHIQRGKCEQGSVRIFRVGLEFRSEWQDVHTIGSAWTQLWIRDEQWYHTVICQLCNKQLQTSFGTQWNKLEPGHPEMIQFLLHKREWRYLWSALHSACLEGMNKFSYHHHFLLCGSFVTSLLWITDEAMNRYNTSSCWRPHLTGTRQYRDRGLMTF